MAITVKHKFVSAIPDAGDTTIVQPSNWNDSHDLTGTVPIANGGTGAATATDAFNALAPSQTGNTGKYLTTNGTDTSWSTNAGGDVVGPASATDNAVARFDTTTGKLIQNSVTLIDDTGNASGILSQQFSNGSAVTLAAGKMWYDGSTGAWNAGMGGGNITQQIGEELFIYGKASAAITDSPLQIIYHTGVVGASGVITFAPTIAGITDENAIIGVATESLALNAFGRVTTFGLVRGITTNGSAFGETWADDDVIWYNPVTGNPTNVKPSAPNIKFQIGLVVKAGAGGSGSFQVALVQGTQLGGTDSNVKLTSPANGNILTYDGGNGYWKNTDLTAGTGISVGKSANGVLTVTNTSPSSGGTVTSVAATVPSFLSVSGSPITTSGTLALTYSGTALPILNGGTGATTASTAFNALSPLTTAGDTLYGGTSGAGTRLAIGTAGQVLTVNAGATAPQWSTPTTGTITAVSVASANGFAGTSSGGATPALTLSTSITGVLKGNATAISAATAGTDYSAGTSALTTGILKSTTTTGALSIAVAADFPTLNQNTTGTAANVTGIVLGANGGTGVANTGSTITVGGNLNHAGAFTQTFTATANTSLTLPTSGTLISTVTNMAANPVTGTPSAITFLRGDGTWATPAGAGTVTSVGLSAPSIFTVTGSPVTTTGTLALTYSGTALPIANGGTNATTAPAAMANLMGWTTTATAAGTTTLTNTSTYQQEFTGTLAQTVVLPVTSTLALGWSFDIINNSTGSLTVQSSGLNTIATVIAGTTASFVCIAITGTTAASWDFDTVGFGAVTGTGSVVLSTSPTLVTPALGTPASGVVTNLTGTASININGTVGATTANTGAFTTLSASSTVSGTGFSTYLASPPAIGGTTAAAGTFTQITVNGASVNTSISPTGTGTVTISPAGALTINPTAASTINNTSIGATTASTGRFTTVTSTVATGTAPFTVASTTQVANLNAATAGASTNLSGGALGSIPYQSAAATTLFLAGNATTTPQFLTSTGAAGVATAPTLTSSTGSGSVVLATSPTLVTPALGTPASGVVTNLTGTASININGTVGATTANTGAFTTISASGVITSTIATGTAPFTITSTTAVANLSIGGNAGTVTNGVYTTSNQICKAWVRFTGSTGAIAGSFNVTSITRNATGDYTINYTSALANTTYSAFMTVSDLRIPQPTVYSTGSVRMNNYTTGGSLADSTFVNVSVFS